MVPEGVDAITMALLTHVNATINAAKKNDIPVRKFTLAEFKEVLIDAGLLEEKPKPKPKYPQEDYDDDEDEVISFQSKLTNFKRDDGRSVK